MISNIFWRNNLFLKSIFIFYYFNAIYSIPCPLNKPFLVGDKACADFNEICIKTGDEQCNRLQDACKQCPPSNLTSLMLLDIMNIVKAQSNFTNEVNRLTVRFNSTEAIFQSKIKKLTDQMTAGLIIVVLFLIIFLPFLIFLTVSIRRIRKPHRKSSQGKGKSSQDKVPFLDTNVDENISFSGLEKNTNTNIENIYSGMQQNINTREFHIVGLDKPIKLDVQGNDNIVTIKHQLYSKLVNKKPHDYKRMRIMVNGKYIDDNDYLLPLIGSSMDEIRCEVDGSIKDSDIIILQLQGNRCLPQFLQINRSQTVSDLIRIISNYKECGMIAIFKDSTKFVVNLTIADCPLADYDWIKVIAIEPADCTASPIFDEGPSQDVKCSNCDKISFIKNVLVQKLGLNFDDLYLIYGSSYCEDDTFLFEMNLPPVFNIQYFNIKKLNGIIDVGEILYKGNSCELVDAIETVTQKKLMMKKFDLSFIGKLKDNKLILNDLIKLQITKTRPEFVKTLGMYQDEKCFYIAMENLKGSLQKNLDMNFVFPESDIFKWAKQMLKGLSFLHENNIVHGDIKPSNILLTEQNDIKLSILGLSKYSCSQKIDHLKKGLTLAKIGTTMYMAPEVKNNVTIELNSDIYSFGVTLVVLFTGVRLSVKDPRKKLLNKLKDPKISFEMKIFLEDCLLEDYQKRPGAKALLDKMA